jgi:hypothetical protein
MLKALFLERNPKGETLTLIAPYRLPPGLPRKACSVPGFEFLYLLPVIGSSPFPSQTEYV